MKGSQTGSIGINKYSREQSIKQIRENDRYTQYSFRCSQKDLFLLETIKLNEKLLSTDVTGQTSQNFLFHSPQAFT